jgi:hypothetical protein
MLAQTQNQIAARDLAVERSIVIEAVIPIDSESQVLDIEFVRLCDSATGGGFAGLARILLS